MHSCTEIMCDIMVSGVRDRDLGIRSAGCGDHDGNCKLPGLSYIGKTASPWQPQQKMLQPELTVIDRRARYHLTNGGMDYSVTSSIIG